MGIIVVLVVGAIAFRFRAILIQLLDPPSLKIFAAYLIITSSVSSTYQVEKPKNFDQYNSKTGFMSFDISGVLACMIQTFEFTFYHNVVLQASLPFTVILLSLTILTVRYSMIKTHFAEKRKDKRNRVKEEREKIDRAEDDAKLVIKEKVISIASQASSHIFTRPPRFSPKLSLPKAQITVKIGGLLLSLYLSAHSRSHVCWS